MKNYDVTITETLQMTVQIEAESRAEAEEIAEENWNSSQYILDADYFKGADFKAVEHNKTRDLER